MNYSEGKNKMKLDIIKTLRDTNRLGMVSKATNGNVIIHELISMWTNAERWEQVNVIATVVRPTDPEYSETVEYLGLGN